MKIAYNPKTSSALTAAPVGDDITFDLPGISIYVKGVRFKGTDTTYSVFKKHTSSGSGGYNGLVPVPPYSTTLVRFLREDGTWLIPASTATATLYVLLSSEDLNLLKDEGRWYYIAGSSSVLNGPTNVNSGAELYVGRNAGGYRYLKIITAGGLVWFRIWNSTSWGAWTRQYTDANTDSKVLQSESTTSNFRPVILGYNNGSDPNALVASTTNLVYSSKYIYALANSGTLFANVFNGNLKGNADTATSLGKINVGSVSLPVYFAAGKPVACVPSSLFSIFTNDGNLLSITIAGLNRKITPNYAVKASYLTLNYCRDDASPSNKGVWNNIKNGKTSATTNKVNFYTIYASDGGPSAYGEMMEILSYNSNHWLPQMWFGSGRTGNVYYRNKDYNNDTWGSWLTILTNINYSAIINGNYYTKTESDARFVNVTGDTMTGALNMNGRLMVSASGYIYPTSTSTRRSGVYGVYDSTKIGHIWSMGTSFTIADDGANFGNLYGFAYKHTNNTTGGNMAGGHQVVWCANGAPKAALGDYVWSANGFLKAGSSNSYVLLGGGGHKALSTMLDEYDARYVNVTGDRMTGNLLFTNSCGIVQTTNTTSNYVTTIKWYLGTSPSASGTYDALVGWHNTGNTTGAVTILPYATTTSPWAGTVGLYIGKNVLRLDGLNVLHSGNYDLYFGYIGTTKVQKISTALALTGIASINGRLTINAESDLTRLGFGGTHSVVFGESGYAHRSYYFRPSYGANGTTQTTIYIQNASASASPTWTTTHSFSASGTATHSGAVIVGGGRYWTNSAYGLNLQNSDIVGANGIYFADAVDSADEGIHFYRSSTTWDTLTAANGLLYFSQNRATATHALTPLFSSLANSGNNISLTIGGLNRTLTVAYASNAGTVGGQAETMFYRTRGTYGSIASSIPTTAELSSNNNLSGSWTVSYPGASGHLMLFNTGGGSTRYVQLYATYNSSLYWRQSTDSTLSSKSWRIIIDTANYTSYVLKIGTATVGATNKGIYLNAGTPTAMSASAGSSALPVYMASGAIVACTASSVFSVLANSGNNLSITVAGQNRLLVVNYSTYASYLSSWDNRSVNNTPSTYGSSARFEFKANSTDGLSNGGSYHGILHFKPYGGTTDFSRGQTHLLGFTDSGNLYMRTSTNSTTWGAWKLLMNEPNANSKYVTALGVNGNYVTWTKNGTVNNLTVPYATTSNFVVGGFSSTFTNSWNCNTPDRVVYSDYGSAGRSITNAPSGWSYGTLLELGHINYRGLNAGLNMLLMWDVAHNTTNGGTLWFRGKDSVKGWAKNWCKVITDLNYTTVLDGRYVKKTGDTMSGSLTAPSFIKTGSNDNYVLLGGGGHKAVNLFIYSVYGSLGVNERTGNSDDLGRAGFWRDNNLGAYGVTLMHSDSANYLCKIYHDYGSGANLYMKTRANGTWGSVYTIWNSGNLNPANYVTALGTSGNYVTWTRNGVTYNLTVPYSLNSDKLDGYHESSFFRHLGTANIASTWSWGTGRSGTSGWSTTASNRGYGSLYGTNLDITGYSTWYHRFALRTDGRIEYWVGINTTTLSNRGTIAWTSELKDPANYYWANIKVSGSSNTGTSPTFSTAYASNWFRTTGSTGWYSESYGGGIYMTDTTWVRTYNNKSFYCSAVILAGNRIWTGYDSGVTNAISCSNWFRSNGSTGWLNASYSGGWYMSDSTYVRSYNSKAVYTANATQSAFNASGGFYSSGSNGYGLTVIGSESTTTRIKGQIGSTVNTAVSRYEVLWYSNYARFDVHRGGGTDISKWSFKYNSTEVAYLTTSGLLYAKGFHHMSMDNNNYVLLAGGSYKLWTTSSASNTLVSRDGSANVFANYYNSSISNSDSMTISSIYCSNDNYIRKMSFTEFKKKFGLLIPGQIISLYTTSTLRDICTGYSMSSRGRSDAQYKVDGTTYVVDLSKFILLTFSEQTAIGVLTMGGNYTTAGTYGSNYHKITNYEMPAHRHFLGVRVSKWGDNANYRNFPDFHGTLNVDGDYGNDPSHFMTRYAGAGISDSVYNWNVGTIGKNKDDNSNMYMVQKTYFTITLVYKP